jgi:hypothetical protein
MIKNSTEEITEVSEMTKNRGDCSTSWKSDKKTNGRNMKSEMLKNEVRIADSFKIADNLITIILDIV